MPLVKGVWRSKTHSEIDLKRAKAHQWHRALALSLAGHYSDRTVTLDCTVTSSWGVPRAPASSGRR